MQKKEVIKTIIRDFQTRPLPAYTPRSMSLPLDIGKIITLIGARRSGKTYLLYQLVDGLCKKVSGEDIVFINFEDERLDLTVSELDLVIQSYRELYPGKDLSGCFFLFDEIANISGWDRFVRRAYDSISHNIVLTGSNARMLGSEIPTALRGRSLSYTLFPLSFSEYLRFKGMDADLYDPASRAAVHHSLLSFLSEGGFPELVHIDDGRLRHKILQEYFQVMMFRDLVDRFQVKNIPALKFFLKRVFACATKPVSIHRIYNDLKSAGVKAGKNALYDYMEMAETVFLVSALRKYASKVSVRELGEKKVYAVDNGLLNAVVFRFSENIGKAMEQAVFWEFRRRDKDIYFYKNGFECDFIVCAKGKVQAAYQVCRHLEDDGTRKREIRGLVNTCREFGLDSGTMITLEQEDTIVEGDVRIDVVSLPRFLLGI